MRKRTIDEIKKLDFVKLSELAELCGIRYSTIKYYSEIGILPFEQRGKRLARYYPAKAAKARLKRISQLKGRGKSIPELLALFYLNRAKRNIKKVMKGEHPKGEFACPKISKDVRAFSLTSDDY